MAGEYGTKEALPVLIRPFKNADAAEACALIKNTLQKVNSRDYPEEVIARLMGYFTPEHLAALAAERQCIIATSGKRIVGTGAYVHGELHTIYVDAAERGRGVGSAIVKRLETLARDDGTEVLRLPASVTGRDFYASLGYRDIEREIDAEWGERIWMSKNLSVSS